MKHISLSLLSLFLVSSLCAQNTITVNKAGNGADYTSLEEAIESASDEDIIMVHSHSGFYGTSESIKIEKKLTIIGEGYLHQNIDERDQNTSIESIEFNTGSEGSSIIGVLVYKLRINVENINLLKSNLSNTIEIEANRTKISQCLIGTQLVSSIPTEGHIINNNIFTNTTSNSHLQNIINSELFNNIFLVFSNNSETINRYNNITLAPEWDASVGSYKFETSTPLRIETPSQSIGYISSTIGEVFDWNESTDGRYKLKENSLAIGIGVNGVDCGIFGGETPYVISGTPSIPRILELNVPENISPGDKLKVSLKIIGN
jgi:hypothetical protein